MNRKRFLIIAALFIAGTVGAYLLLSSRMKQPHSQLTFVRHTTNGVTHVAVFRLKCNDQRGELDGPGEIISGAAHFDARWVTNFSAKVPSRGERQFAVIAPYERTPWRLQVTLVQKPSKLLVKLRTSWFLLRTRKAAAFPHIKAVWQKKSSIPSMWPVIMAQSQFDKPSWKQTIASDLVTNTVDGH